LLSNWTRTRVANQVLGISTALAPGILNPAYTQQIVTACRALADADNALNAAMGVACPGNIVRLYLLQLLCDTVRYQTHQIWRGSTQSLAQSSGLTGKGMEQLINAATSAGKKGREPVDFITPLEVCAHHPMRWLSRLYSPHTFHPLLPI
jgi:hypothetical protein